MIAALTDPTRRRADIVDEAFPPFESLPTGELAIQHSAGPPPHFGDKIGVPRKAQKRVGKKLSLPGLDYKPTPMPPNKSADFTVRRGDGDNPTSGGGDTIELARHY